MLFFLLQLLCQYEPDSVLHFLETCESYRVDYCLRLCQEHKIIDATAFLLERVGDVGSALAFTLSDLADKFSLLDAAAQSVYDDAGVDHFNEAMKKEVCYSLTHLSIFSVGEIFIFPDLLNILFAHHKYNIHCH